MWSECFRILSPINQRLITVDDVEHDLKQKVIQVKERNLPCTHDKFCVGHLLAPSVHVRFSLRLERKADIPIASARAAALMLPPIVTSAPESMIGLG